MSAPESVSRPDPAVLARIREFAERRLTADEFAAITDAPFTDRELESTRELIRWFKRRYPTPLDRLRYARGAYARWALLSAAVDAGEEES